MKKYILAVALVFGLFVFDMESCFAETAVIPGFFGSAGGNIADMSSAVFKPTTNNSNLCVAVWVKAAPRFAEEKYIGVWYFMYYGMSNKVGVKTNNSSEFDILEVHDIYGHDLMLDFMKELINAAEANRRR